MGITGGIGSGKSTLARMMTRYGVTHLDADTISREVSAPGTPGLAMIVKEFGTSILTASGDLDRRRLGDIVFNDCQARRRLQEIIHPLITHQVKSRLQTLPGPIVYEATLLLESGHDSLVDMVVTVSAPADTRLKRIQVRPGMTEEKARTLISVQQSDQWREERSHAVVRNTGDLQDLMKDAQELAFLMSE